MKILKLLNKIHRVQAIIIGQDCVQRDQTYPSHTVEHCRNVAPTRTLTGVVSPEKCPLNAYFS